MSNWQPIETAPKDGKDILLFFRQPTTTEIMIAHFISFDDGETDQFGADGDWYEQNDSRGYPLDVEPTHWQPLPDPPVAS